MCSGKSYSKESLPVHCYVLHRHCRVRTPLLSNCRLLRPTRTGQEARASIDNQDSIVYPVLGSLGSQDHPQAMARLHRYAAYLMYVPKLWTSTPTGNRNGRPQHLHICVRVLRVKRMSYSFSSLAFSMPICLITSSSWNPIIASLVNSGRGACGNGMRVSGYTLARHRTTLTCIAVLGACALGLRAARSTVSSSKDTMSAKPSNMRFASERRELRLARSEMMSSKLEPGNSREARYVHGEDRVGVYCSEHGAEY